MLRVKPGKNPLDTRNCTNIASFPDYKLYSDQISNMVVVSNNNDESVSLYSHSPHLLKHRGCFWCCGWHPSDH